MPITAEQRAARRHVIGSSDSPAILHCDPDNSEYNVWASKVYELDEITDNEAIEIGNDFELPLLQWASRELGLEIEVNVPAVSRENPLFAANLDARAKDRTKRIGIEAKTTSRGYRYGAEGTDNIPDRDIVQTQHQMFVDDLDVVYVPVLLPVFNRLKRRMYKVKRNETIIKAIKKYGVEFWENHVIPKVPPSQSRPRIDVLKRIRREAGEEVDIDLNLVWLFEQRRDERKRLEDLEDVAKAALIAALGDAEFGDYGDPRFVYRYLAEPRTRVEEKRLKLERRDIYDEFSKESRPRVLRRVKR